MSLLLRIAFVLILTAPFAKASASESSSKTLLSQIPLHFTASVAGISATNSFEDAKEDYSFSGYGLGSSLEIPMPGIHSMLGVTGMLGFDRDEKNNADYLVFYAAYIGVAFASFDIIFGPAGMLLDKTLKGPYTSPDTKIEFDTRMSGGFIGIRKNFFSGGPTGLGFALKGFYLTDNEYDKTVTASGGGEM